MQSGFPEYRLDNFTLDESAEIAAPNRGGHDPEGVVVCGEGEIDVPVRMGIADIVGAAAEDPFADGLLLKQGLHNQRVLSAGALEGDHGPRREPDAFGNFIEPMGPGEFVIASLEFFPHFPEVGHDTFPAELGDGFFSRCQG